MSPKPIVCFLFRVDLYKKSQTITRMRQNITNRIPQIRRGRLHLHILEHLLRFHHDDEVVFLRHPLHSYSFSISVAWITATNLFDKNHFFFLDQKKPTTCSVLFVATYLEDWTRVCWFNRVFIRCGQKSQIQDDLFFLLKQIGFLSNE